MPISAEQIQMLRERRARMEAAQSVTSSVQEPTQTVKEPTQAVESAPASEVQGVPPDAAQAAQEPIQEKPKQEPSQNPTSKPILKPIKETHIRNLFRKLKFH